VRRQHAVRPQSDLCVTFSPREAHALINKLGAQPESARFRVHQQQAQPRDIGLVVFHQHDAADILAIHLDDPAALALGIEIVDEIGDDLRTQALKRFGPAILTPIKFGVARHDPAEIAGAGFAKCIGRTRNGVHRRRAGQQCLDRFHGGNDLRLLRAVEAGEHRCGILLRALFHRREHFASPRGQGEVALACVALGDLAVNEPAFLEVAQEPAEISHVEVERAGDIARRQFFVLGKLIEHAHLTERVGTVEIIFAQHADLPRVEAVKAANGRDRLLAGHGAAESGN